MTEYCWCGGRALRPKGFIRCREAGWNSAKRCTPPCTREVDEETSLKIEIVDLAGWREVVPGPAGGGHYLIMSFAARWVAKEPVLNDELDDFKWLPPDALGDLKLTGGLHGSHPVGPAPDRRLTAVYLETQVCPARLASVALKRHITPVLDPLHAQANFRQFFIADVGVQPWPGAGPGRGCAVRWRPAAAG